MDPSAPSWAPRLATRRLPPERFLLPSVRLFDPSLGLDVEGDLLVEEGRIAAIGPRAGRPPSGARGTPELEILGDLQGCWVFPGFVDVHAHLRTPGYEYKEDLTSGSLAAAAGGYVTVIAMANTNPSVDGGPVAAWILDQASQQAAVRVGQVGAVSKGRKGEELAELRELFEAGVAAFSDDGDPVADADLLLNALRYLRGTGRPVLLHEENRSLSMDGVMHEGKWSARLGLKGIPEGSETAPLARDLELIRYVAGEDARLAEDRACGAGDPSSVPPLVHFQHVSSAGSVRLLREAKRGGLPVTAEVTPHNLLLTDAAILTFDQSFRVNPPLRSEDDRHALIEALKDGTIDAVATDHAPHAPHEKEVPIEDAVMGTIGLETAFAALHSGLVLTGVMPMERLVETMSAGPCRCLSLSAPRLEEGAPADFCVVDLAESWQVTPADLRSKSRNSCFMGQSLTGRVLLTVVDGTRRYQRERQPHGPSAGRRVD